MPVVVASPNGPGRLAGLTVAQGEQDRLNDLSADGFECSGPQPDEQTPSLRLQQPLPELSVAGQKQPVLRQHQARGSTFRAQLQAALQEHGGQIVLCGGIVPLAEFAQPFSLFAAGEVGYVGHDPMIPPRQQFRSTCHTLGSHGMLGLFIARVFLLKHGGEQFPHRFVIVLEKVGLQGVWVDQRAEFRRLCEEIVECFQAVAKR